MQTSTPNHSMNTPRLKRVIYRSVASRPLDRRNVLSILHDARAYNQIDEISGLLLHDHGNFLQVIEGPTDAIDALLNRLMRDDRHCEFETLSDELVKDRLFPDWQMGFGDLEDQSLEFLPGALNATGQAERLKSLADHLPELATKLTVALNADETAD